LKKVSPYVVKTEGGGFVCRPPPFPFSDCRGCSLLELTCEELEYARARILARRSMRSAENMRKEPTAPTVKSLRTVSPTSRAAGTAST